MGNELGMIKEGYLADLLLVDGDPIADVAHPAGQEPHSRHHEGRQVPQGAADEGAAPAADGMSDAEHRGTRPFEPRQLGLGVLFGLLAAALLAVAVLRGLAGLAERASWTSKKAFVNSIFNGVTLAGLYFLVASGFTLVFGLMRNVNLAHGSLYLLGAYVGYEVAERDRLLAARRRRRLPRARDRRRC